MQEDDIKKLLPRIIKYVQSDEIEDDIRQQITQVLSEYNTKFDVFLVSLVNTRLSSVSLLIQSLETVETKMLTAEMLQNCDMRDLLAVHGAIRNSLKEIVDLVMTVKDMNVKVPNAVQNNQFIFNMEGVDRKNVSSMIGQILTKASKISLDGSSGQ